MFSVVLAAGFAAASNFFMRRGIDSGGTAKAFIMIQMFVALLVAMAMGPMQADAHIISGSIALLGAAAGVFLVFMLTMLGKALEHGPSGLTFSILSGATVFPGMIMAVLFGSSFGFIFNNWHAIGSILVLGGLFWAGKGLTGLRDRKRWMLFVAAMFLCHILILMIFQWRALLLRLEYPEELSSYFTSVAIRSPWFMPMLYLSASLIQIGLYLKTEKRIPSSMEWLNGAAGGVASCLCSFFLIRGTELAVGLENAVILPMYSIGVIVFSNLWSQCLYREQVNWRAAQICSLGLFIGTVDWTSVLALYF